MGEPAQLPARLARRAHRTRARAPPSTRKASPSRIDAVDLGTGESNIHAWQVCPQCGWAGISPSGEQAPTGGDVPALPDSAAIADVSQHLPVVEMTRVSAEVRRDEATINDFRDNRKQEPFTVVTAADVDPAQVGRPGSSASSAFGAEYLRRLDIRWINLGRRTSTGQEAA